MKLSTIPSFTTSEHKKGFILPFTMLISVLVLLVAGSVLTLLSKQLFFSKIYKQSQTAYYAADDALICAIEIDDTYVGSDGLGIFPSNIVDDPMTYMSTVLTYYNTAKGKSVALDDIQCAQSALFKVASSSFAVSPTNYQYNSPISGLEEGKTSTYTMRMPLGGGAYRCAKVTVNKTHSFRQIISQGYAKCDDPNGSVERAVVNTTISE